MTITHGALSPRRRAAGILAAGLALALPVSGLAAAGAVAQDGPLVLDHGHIDAFNLDPDENGNPVLNLKEDVTGMHVRHTPEDVVLHVKEEALSELPAVAAIPEALHNQTVYHLPLTQDHNLVWPGWDSQGLQGSQWTNVDINIQSVSGPGDVHLWSNGSFGNLIHLLNDSQTQLPGTIHQSFFAHVHAHWAFTEPGEYTLVVNAQAHNAEESSPVTESHAYTFTVGDYEIAPAVTITGLAHHYHQGSPIVLNAEVDPAVDGGAFEWFVQRVDQSEPVQVEGLTGAEFTIAAEQALHGAEVSVRALDADGSEIAVAESVVIDVDDHGAPPFNEVTISGLQHHYHTGDIALLTATVEPESVLNRWVWEVQEEDSDDWVAVDGENGADYSFEVTEDLNGAQIRVALTFNDGANYVTSDPVAIEVDDHHGEEPVETTLTIEGLQDHYQVGDIATLAAVQDPETDEDHYHWFIKRVGEDDYSVIQGALAGVLEYEVTDADAGADIIVRLYDHDRDQIAESDPVTLSLAGDEPGGDQPGDDEPGADEPGGGADDSPSGNELPRTGTELAPMILFSALMIALAAAVLMARRRMIGDEE